MAPVVLALVQYTCTSTSGTGGTRWYPVVPGGTQWYPVVPIIGPIQCQNNAPSGTWRDMASTALACLALWSLPNCCSQD